MLGWSRRCENQVCGSSSTLDDHPPAHVHVFGDGTAKIALAAGDEAPEVVRTAGMKASELKKALRIVIEHRAALIEKWEELHD